MAIRAPDGANKLKLFHKLIMNNKITGGSLYPNIYFGQFRFLNVLSRVIQTKLLQEPVLGVGPLWVGPLMANAILNFHFDFLTTSLSQD